jgi:hypothetical protein
MLCYFYDKNHVLNAERYMRRRLFSNTRSDWPDDRYEAPSFLGLALVRSLSENSPIIRASRRTGRRCVTSSRECFVYLGWQLREGRLNTVSQEEVQHRPKVSNPHYKEEPAANIQLYIYKM